MSRYGAEYQYPSIREDNRGRPGIASSALVCWLTKYSRSRFGRRASSSSRLGIAAIWQWFGSPRKQPRRARFKCSVSRRSVLAGRCSRATAMLVEWMKARRHEPAASAPAKSHRDRPQRRPLCAGSCVQTLLPPRASGVATGAARLGWREASSTDDDPTRGRFQRRPSLRGSSR